MFCKAIKKLLPLGLVFALLLSFCSCTLDRLVGDGRGDWTVDLQNGYAISKINSREILIIHKENVEDSGGEIVISNYFVKAYQVQKKYICLEGIRTEGMAATEQELEAAQRIYYIINTDTGEIIGPLSNDAFLSQGELLGTSENFEWEYTQ